MKDFTPKGKVLSRCFIDEDARVFYFYGWKFELQISEPGDTGSYGVATYKITIHKNLHVDIISELSERLSEISKQFVALYSVLFGYKPRRIVSQLSITTGEIEGQVSMALESVEYLASKTAGMFRANSAIDSKYEDKTRIITKHGDYEVHSLGTYVRPNSFDKKCVQGYGSLIKYDKSEWDMRKDGIRYTYNRTPVDIRDQFIVPECVYNSGLEDFFENYGKWLTNYDKEYESIAECIGYSIVRWDPLVSEMYGTTSLGLNMGTNFHTIAAFPCMRLLLEDTDEQNRVRINFHMICTPDGIVTNGEKYTDVLAECHENEMILKLDYINGYENETTVCEELSKPYIAASWLTLSSTALSPLWDIQGDGQDSSDVLYSGVDIPTGSIRLLKTYNPIYNPTDPCNKRAIRFTYESIFITKNQKDARIVATEFGKKRSSSPIKKYNVFYPIKANPVFALLASAYKDPRTKKIKYLLMVNETIRYGAGTPLDECEITPTELVLYADICKDYIDFSKITMVKATAAITLCFDPTETMF